MSVAPPRIALFERRTLSQRARTGLTVGFVTLVYSWKFAYFQRLLKSEAAFLTGEDRRAFRLRRRFVAGATAGYIAGRYSLAESGDRRKAFIYADLCAAWSNFLIAADAAMDIKALARGDSRELLRMSFDAMFGPVELLLSDDLRSAVSARYLAVFQSPYQQPSGIGAIPGGPQFRLERYAVRMASEIGKDIAILWDSHFAASFPDSFRGALHQFFTRTLDLMAGQLSTLDQSCVDDEHDWGWYKDVLHNKFMNVLLSPISLFVNPKAQRNPEEVMRECFYLINRTFFHRQVLDDLMDFDEDLSNYTANSLIYILVSQGRIAAAAAGDDPPCNEAAILRELARSGLLAPEFQIEPGSEFYDGNELAAHGNRSPCQPGSVAALVRTSLVNSSSDRAMPLGDLLAECRRRKTALLDAWVRRDHRAVTEIVERSGIAGRILAGIAARRDQGEIEQALERLLDDEGIREFMYVYYSRTLRTYQRCLRKWRSRDAGPSIHASE